MEMNEARIDEDIDKTKPPFLIPFTAFIVGLEGLFLLVLALQNLLFIKWASPYRIAPVAMVPLGILTIALAFMFGKVRGWAVWATMALEIFLILGTAVWFFISISSGVLSPLAFLVLGGSIVSCLLVLVCLKACMDVLAARRRLRQQDMDFGV